MTTYGYARVSTDSQTLDAQLHALAPLGCEVFTDDGVSGSVPALGRPAMAALVAKLQRGDTFVAFSLSRVGRNTLDVLSLLELLTQRGIHFRSLSENFDTSTAMGRAMLSIMAAINQLERDLAIERTNAGIAAAKAKGVRFGREETEGRREAVAWCASMGMRKADAARHLRISYNAVKRMWPGEAA